MNTGSNAEMVDITNILKKWVHLGYMFSRKYGCIYKWTMVDSKRFSKPLKQNDGIFI